MKQSDIAVTGADIFDGAVMHRDSALVWRAEGAARIVPASRVPAGCDTRALNGGVITPGFVDLQVNGGGGVMFNDAQDVQTLATIARAHASTGTTGLLPTLITDTAPRTRAAIDAVVQAIDEKLPGVIGIHLEGPHLSVARKGAHDADLIRPMTDADMAVFLDAADRLANVMLTVAPENVTDDQIAQLAGAGVIVSLGHTDAGFDRCMAAFDAGARCATHLFNAMSQLNSRAPGLVGAALSHPGVSAGLIADGVHVHPATMRVALGAKSVAGPDAPGQVFLVTDAMAAAGSDLTEFMLNGRRVLRHDGRLTLEDGTLAGADLDFGRALSVLVDQVGIDLAQALAMATSGPARLLRDDMGVGRINGGIDGLIHLDTGTYKTAPLGSFFA